MGFKTKIQLHALAEKIAKETNFTIDKEIYRGIYYSVNNIRNLIFTGEYKNKPAVLKIYDDPRLTDEPISQINFNKVNKSKILIAPEVYAHKIISPQKGWLIMEKLPENGSFLTQPVKDKKGFADLYLEYRTSFPLKPTRPLVLAENLPADEFHVFRISRWLELANAKEASNILLGEKPLLDPKQFIRRFENALSVIRKEFKKRKMVWCHGHFKPHELFKTPDGKYYLTDFAHSKMYPEGYEFGFIIWADWLIHGDWKSPYSKWKKGINDWLEVLRPIARKISVKGFDNLMRASLAERIIGTILADVCASERPAEEKNKRINLAYHLLDDIFIKRI